MLLSLSFLRGLSAAVLATIGMLALRRLNSTLPGEKPPPR